MNCQQDAVARLIAEAAVLIGPKGVSTDQQEIAPWLTDWRGLYKGAARAILSPADTRETAALVRRAAELRVPLVPQGGNTSMVGGATPDDSGMALILSTRRMNRVRSLNARTAVAEAGVVLQHLHEAAEREGVRFPLTLGARGSATVGGLVSTNAGGTQVLRFGTMRALVSGIEAVLPDGSIFDSLASLKKDNRGYDLTQLLIGAEGTLGIVTAAALKLVPMPHDKATGWAAVATPQGAYDLLRFMEDRSGAAVESFELVPDGALQLVLRHIPGTRAPIETATAWHVLIDYVSGPDADPEAALTEHLAAAMELGTVTDAAVAANVAQADAFWKLRESISEAERAEGPTAAHDISVPIDAMPAFTLSIAAEVETAFPDTATSAYGHLGDGNIHFHVRPRPGVDGVRWKADVAPAASRLVYDLVTDAGGSISAEHGIGQMKRAALARLGDPARLRSLVAIKSALDPAGIMNPGKLVPSLAPEPIAQ